MIIHWPVIRLIPMFLQLFRSAGLYITKDIYCIFSLIPPPMHFSCLLLQVAKGQAGMWEQGNNVPAIYTGFFLHVERGNEPLNIKLCTLIYQTFGLLQPHFSCMQFSCCSSVVVYVTCYKLQEMLII